MSASGRSPLARAAPLERDENGRQRFQGCSSIREFDFLGKLGEGTFGYGHKYLVEICVDCFLYL